MDYPSICLSKRLCRTWRWSGMLVVLVCIVVAAGSVSAKAASTGETDPPAFNNDRPATLVETIPADVDGEGEAANGAGALVVFGFRLQMAGGYNGELPFWIHANRFGELSPRSANTTLHLFGAWRRTFRSGV